MNKHFLTEIQITRFKCFNYFHFGMSSLSRVNLIGGKNNIGKTALMEACYIHVHSKSINSMITAIINIKYARECLNIVGNPVDNLVYFLDGTQTYQAASNLLFTEFIRSEVDATKKYTFRIIHKSKEIIDKEINANELSIIVEQINNIKFIDNFGWTDNELTSAYRAIQKDDQEANLNAFIKEFDESIESFKVIGNKPQCKINGEYRDLVELGDGLRHYISIICALFACKDGYLFVDEIDNGIHYTQLDRLWELILTLSKQTHCQLFAVTHSKEMLESFARVAKKLDERDISYITLVKDNKQEIKALTRDYELLLDSIEQEREVRGW